MLWMKASNIYLFIYEIKCMVVLDKVFDKLWVKASNKCYLFSSEMKCMAVLM